MVFGARSSEHHVLASKRKCVCVLEREREREREREKFIDKQIYD
jgi:hypothetical protein